jgi:two-component system chemotaxis response regulator CheY
MPKKILLTDNALFMPVTLKNLLVNNGYEIAGEAFNGKDAPQRVLVESILKVAG